MTPEPMTPEMELLTEQERTILEIERQWWQHDGTKEEQVWARLGLTSTRYNLRLNRLLDDGRVVAADPLTVRRLRRLRATRRSARASG